MSHVDFVRRPSFVVPLVLWALASCMSVWPDAARAADPPERWVAVSVATLWVKPGLARAIDAPACADPADPAAWVAALTVEQKRWLVGRLETQALYGQRVYLLGRSGAWSRIAVPGQPTPRHRLGYPGWVPSVQLTDEPPALAPGAAERMAIVKHRTVWLWESPELTGRALRLSYGTRLAAVAWTPTAVEVIALDGRRLYVRRSTVALRIPGEPWPAVTGTRLVKEVKRFIGLQYLWAGTAGFGFDCSGLTHAAHRALGRTIPRDAGPQAARGTRIGTRSALRPGDLVFFRNAAGHIHHVGMFVGGDQMVHSPRTGAPVRTASIYREPYFSEFAGGRRYWRAAGE
jgi:cell wall-associated NlpC family hydrolase